MAAGNSFFGVLIKNAVRIGILILLLLVAGSFIDNGREKYPAEEVPNIKNVADRNGLAGIPSYSRGAAWIDVDGDGWEDLWVSSPGFGRTVLYRNRGNGTFAAMDLGIATEDLLYNWSGVWGDYDNDGDTDVYLVNGGGSGQARNGFYRNDLNRLGRFTNVMPESGFHAEVRASWGASWADFDQDGWLDLAVVAREGPPWLYRNQGNGMFKEVSNESGVSVNLREGKHPLWFDFDNDGDQDLYLAGIYNHRLYKNVGGRFVDVTALLDLTPFIPKGEAPTVFSAVSADFNQDGWLDLYLGRWSRQDLLFLNRGDGTFQGHGKEIGIDTIREENTMGLGAGDLNNDGYPEIFIGTGDPHRKEFDVIFCNRGKTSAIGEKMFYRCSEPIVTGHGKSRTHAIVLADPDHDGDADVFFAIGGHCKETECAKTLPDQAEHSAFYGQVSNGRKSHSATIHLVGTKSNRSAVGARVTVEGSETHYYTVHGTQGFQGQNSDWLLMTLGSSPKGTITITWPSGNKRTLQISAGERKIVTE